MKNKIEKSVFTKKRGTRIKREILKNLNRDDDCRLFGVRQNLPYKQHRKDMSMSIKVIVSVKNSFGFFGYQKVIFYDE